MSQYKGQSQIPLAGVVAPLDEFHWKRGSGPAMQVKRQGRLTSAAGTNDGLYYAAFGCEPGGYPAQTGNGAFPLHLYFDSIDITRTSGTMFRLDASQAGEALTEIHEVSGSNQSRSKSESLVLRNRFIAAGYGTLAKADAALATIKENARLRNSDSTYTPAKEKSDNHAGAPAGALTLIDQFSADIKLGETFIDCMYAYRHTIIIPERSFRNNNTAIYTFANVFLYVGRSFSEAQLRSTEYIPAYPYFVLPNKLSEPSVPAFWLKQAPHSHLATGQKRVITIEYLHADILSDLYYAPR